MFSSSNSKEKIETLWLETTLKKINNIELNTDLLENSDFVQKAFEDIVHTLILKINQILYICLKK
ncbi:hypothetical protein NW733_06960 [Mycoplasmopsis felis]|uniref:hypothetical protein n=1 Tax=Mycoplasmopsis felis TaxID=33923 RepID=UPI0021DF46DD|nr:hypothetical protein [Mycoplasmopsis felis]MCU9932332.1 hypothetical protein [Mycoplasmopsis felis]